jgi:ABC-2 type transport system permease protein
MIWFISILIRETSGFMGIMALAGVFGGLGGWNIYEICILFSMCAIVEAVGQTFFDSIWLIERSIRRGDIDTFLVRPASPFVQLLGQSLHLEALLNIFIYIFIFTWAALMDGIVFNVHLIFTIIECIIWGVIINSGIYTIFNCLNFWIIQGEDVAILVQTCREFVKYPLNIFPKFIQTFFTYVLPFGFVGYYPTLYILGKTSIPLGIIMPFVAVFVVPLGMILWRTGIKGYNSTGT